MNCSIQLGAGFANVCLFKFPMVFPSWIQSWAGGPGLIEPPFNLRILWIFTQMDCSNNKLIVSILIPLILTAALNLCTVETHFTDEEKDPERGSVTGPR